MTDLTVNKMIDILNGINDAVRLLPQDRFNTDRLLTTEEAAGFLSTTKKWLHTQANHGEIPFYEVGKGRRWKLSDLLALQEKLKKQYPSIADKIFKIKRG